MMLIVISM